MLQTKYTRIAGLVFGLAAASAWAAEIPRKASELDIRLPGGKQLLLSQYKGKVVALAFISTT